MGTATSSARHERRSARTPPNHPHPTQSQPQHQHQHQQQQQQQIRPSMTNYPASMRLIENQQQHNTQQRPMAQQAPNFTPVTNTATTQPRNAVREGQNIKQLATIDRSSVKFEAETGLLTFRIVSSIATSYEIHTGVKSTISHGAVIYVPNRNKPKPTAYEVPDAQEDGFDVFVMLDAETPQMHISELTWNKQYPRYHPCSIILSWKDADGFEFKEHTFINLGSPAKKGAAAAASPPPVPEAPGKVNKQLLSCFGSFFLIESLFGFEGDVVVAEVAAGDGEGGPARDAAANGGGVSPANGDVTATRQPTEDDDDDGLCVICISAPKDTCVIPCRHLCMCKGCAQELQKHSPKCPVCRQAFGQLLHMNVPH